MYKSLKWFKNKAAYLAATILLMQHTFVFAAPMELSLDDSVQLALKNNPAIGMSKADRDKSQYSIDEAKGGALPSISLGSTYNVTDKSASTPGSDSLNNSLRLNWQLYNGGRTQSQIQQAQMGLTSADLGVDKTKQQIKLDATTAYYNVLQAKSLLDVNNEAVNNLQAHQDVAQAKYNAGVVAKDDVLSAEVQLANAQQNLVKSKNQYQLALTSLDNVMNINADTDLQLTDELKYTAYDKSLDECIQMAKDNSPDVAQAKNGIDMANTGVKIAESGKLPSVSLSAGTGWNNILPDNNNWSVGVSANWDIFDSGITNAKVKEAQTAVDKANLQQQQVADSVEQNVRQSYLSMKEAEERLTTTEVAVNKAEEDLNIAKEKYNAGVGINMDVIDAQLALTQAKTNYIQALYDFNINNAKLDNAMGIKVK